MFHPSLEEEGVESGLLDIWAFRWHGYDGSKMPSEKAEVLSVYIRIPESSFEYVHQSLVSKGFSSSHEMLTPLVLMINMLLFGCRS